MQPLPETDAEGRVLLDDSRRIAAQVKQEFSVALVRSLDMGSILKSFSVCRYEAVEIVSRASRIEGIKVARVSLHPRNPGVAAADAWEQRILREFEWRAHAGESVQDLEFGESVNEPSGPVFRYMAALPVRVQCLGCHGAEAALTAAVRAQLEVDYPTASGSHFVAGGIGGAISIRRPR